MDNPAFTVEGDDSDDSDDSICHLSLVAKHPTPAPAQPSSRLSTPTSMRLPSRSLTPAPTQLPSRLVNAAIRHKPATLMTFFGRAKQSGKNKKNDDDGDDSDDDDDDDDDSSEDDITNGEHEVVKRLESAGSTPAPSVVPSHDSATVNTAEEDMDPHTPTSDLAKLPEVVGRKQKSM